MRKPARPGPPPQTPIAKRLELVRTRNDFLSLRSFWEHLSEDWPKDEGRVSYEAARNYHYDRNPPVAYLARVAKVFEVRLDYLIKDSGEMTEEEERQREDGAGIQEASQFADTSPAPDIARERRRKRHEAALNLKHQVLSAMRIPKWEPSGITVGSEPLEEYVPVWVGSVAEVQRRIRQATFLLSGSRTLSLEEAGEEVAQALAGPIASLGIDAAQLDDTALGDYVMAMVPILLSLVPEKYGQALTEAENPNEHQ